MTGLEAGTAAVAKMAGPAAGRLAAAIGMKLGKSRTLRWRVRRRAAKAVDFAVPKRQYAAWLKQIDVATLAEPVESAGPRLAVSLDECLMANHDWALSANRHGRALSLVRQTYLAMEALSDAPDARELSSSWAEARYSVMIDYLAKLVGPTLLLNRDQIADHLIRQSQARRSVRLRSFGLEPEVVEYALDAYKTGIPSVQGGQTVVVVGPYGSGKSELAELWFREAVERFRGEATACQPLWLRATELIATSLDSEITARLGNPVSASSSLSLVIDGLDEVESVAATRILEYSQILVHDAPNIRILLTCRPGVLPDDGSQIAHDGIDRQDAISLIEAISGSAKATWGWDPALIDAIKRPFFALSAGIVIGQGDRPTGQADLIGRLVNRALTRPSSATTATRDESLFRLLVKLAVCSTESGNSDDGLSFRERQEVLRSTLVQEVGGHVEFSLPIFQQWFASTEVVADPALAVRAVSDAQSFDRWRWALAVACLGSTPEQLDDILSVCFEANPGAGAWVLSRIAEGHQGFRRPDGDDLDASTAGQRLLRATRTWIRSLGELSPAVFPVATPSTPIGLGVRVSGPCVNTGWLIDPPESDILMELPAHVHPMAGSDGTWWPDRAGYVSEGDEWPWTLVGKRVSGSSLRILNSNRLIGGDGGIWQAEARYSMLRTIMRSRSVFYPPIDRGEALGRVEMILSSVTDATSAGLKVLGKVFTGYEAIDLANWLRTYDAPAVLRPLPVPDRPLSGSGMVWDIYSDERLRAICAEVLGNACEAYDEAVKGMFSAFSWSFGTGDPGTFGILAELALRNDSPMGRVPLINKVILPLEVLQEEVGLRNSEFLMSTNKRAAVAISNGEDERMEHRFRERVRDLHDRHIPVLARRGPFRRGLGWSGSVASFVHDDRPASQIAARWLWNDLKALDLADGTFPQLDP